jgi:cysteine desulfurase
MARPAIYLDHNAATALLPEARAAMLEAMDLVGNPSSVHANGRAARDLVERARARVAKATGAERQQVVFTSSATEALTQAIVGAIAPFGISRILTSASEHAAVLRASESAGAPVTILDVDANGVIDLAGLGAALNAATEAGETVLVAVHWVNNETGVVQPMARIAALVGPTRHLLVVDAVQAFGKVPLDFAASATDMMAISGHKVGGAAGAAALLVKAHADMVRLIPGGGQEQGRRGGTEALIAIAGFGAAAEAFAGHYDLGRVKAMADRLEAEIVGLAPDAVIFGQGAERIGNTVDFAVAGLTNAVAMMGLDLEGVSISSGSACSSGKVGASHVLAAMGVPRPLADCALRVSLGWNSVDSDIDAFVVAFAKVLDRNRSRRGQAA